MTALLQILFASLIASAFTSNKVVGPKDGGGGKGIRCGKTTYLADTFDLVRAGSLGKLKAIEPGAVIAAAAEIADQLHPQKIYPHPLRRGENVSIGWMIEHQYAALNFAYVMHDGLPDFPDDHIDSDSLPEDCHKVQIAVQDLAAGVVERDYELIHSLSRLENGLLELHETFVALRHLPGEDTTPIRREVHRIAEVLDDPRLSIRALVLSILNPPMISSGERNRGEDYLYEHCQSRLYDIKPQPGDSEQTRLCRSASAQAMAEDKRNDRQAALPTLTEMPEHLNCRTTYQGTNGMNWDDPVYVRLDRVAGSGRPKTESTYRLNLPGAGGPSAAFLDTRRHHRDGGFRFHGDLDFRIGWSTDAGQVLFFVHHFVDRTKELVGSVQLTRHGGAIAPENYSVYGLVCDGSEANFALEFEGSVP